MNSTPQHPVQGLSGRAADEGRAVDSAFVEHCRVALQAALGGLDLGEPDEAFPVQASHRVASDMAKLEGPLIQTDKAYPSYAAQRLALLAGRADTTLMPETPLPGTLWPAIWQALGLHQASWTRQLGLDVTDQSVTLGAFAGLVPGSVMSRVPAGALALSLALQEDWVLMDEAGLFEGGAVCFPSGWAPGEKHGLPLSQIHQPVADGDALRKASPALARAMALKGPFVRHVWTLCRNASLPRHPGYAEDTQAESSEALYFRSERQTTLALPAFGRALFLIRIRVSPLESVLSAGDRAERLARLKSALASMSESVLAYKNLAAIREQVLALN